MHRLPRLWPEPDRFDPSRFDPDQVAQRSRFSFVPFVAGHRNSIGGTMAIAEIKLAVAQFAQHYVLDLAPGHRVEEAAGTVMHPRYGMKMSIRHAPTKQALPASSAAEAGQ
jgi:cytochrome P450